jgi:hypothetical protein
MSRPLLAALCLLGSALSFASENTAASEGSAPPSLLNPAAQIESWLATLPPWLRLGAEIRGRSDDYFGLNAVPGQDDAYYLHRFRLNAQVSPSGWMRLVTQIQDSRQGGYGRKPIPYSVAQPADLRLSYVEFGRGGEEAPLSVRVGRQPLVFGDMRLVGTSNWGNVGPAYDALRVSLRPGSVRLDGFASFVVTPCKGFDAPRRDKMLSGVYASFDLLGKTRTVDVYLFWKRDRRAASLLTYGVRSAGPLPYRWDYNAELALQRGRFAGESVAAWAGHWEIGRKLQCARRPLRLAAEYNYASGDKAPRDGHYGSFDAHYPTNIFGTAADFGWRNLHEPRVYFEWQPDRKTRVQTAYHWFWLAERGDALYNFAGAVFAFLPHAADAYVGSAFDLRCIRQISRHLQVWLGYAQLFPGPYLTQAGRAAIEYPYAMWNFSF